MNEIQVFFDLDNGLIVACDQRRGFSVQGYDIVTVLNDLVDVLRDQYIYEQAQGE